MNNIIEAINEVQRELTVRQHVYPRLVAQGKLTQQEAERRACALDTARYYLIEQARAMKAKGILLGKSAETN